MSATGRSDVRLPNDTYNTPQELCDAIVNKLKADQFLSTLDSETGIILEPSAGSGNFISSLKKFAPEWTVHALDIEVGHCLKEVCSYDIPYMERDFLEFGGCKYNGIIGNPPYSLAEAHIRHGLGLLRPGGFLAFLLRLNFLESKKRIQFWSEFPATKIYPLAERPSFVSGGTDACAYGVFVWTRGYKGQTELEVMSWK